MIPYFYNLVKDPKRLSLVFETKDMLYAFVQGLQDENLFGAQFDREVCCPGSNIFVRVQELKNGFSSSARQGG